MKHFLAKAEQDALRAHNDARTAKGLQPLQWDSKLAVEAEEYARVLTLKRQMEHSGCEDGENLFMGGGGDYWYNDAVHSWLAEEPFYHGQKIPKGDFMSYGHYTQCMWSCTTHVGMGAAKTLDGTTFIVARYSPAGNMQDERPW